MTTYDPIPQVRANELTLGQLTQVHSLLAPASSFRGGNRKQVTKAVFAAVAGRWPGAYLGEDGIIFLPVGVEFDHEALTFSEPTPKEKPAVEAAATETAKPARAHTASGENREITVLAAENPKRVGSKAHARFALYRTGMTVAEFFAAGGTASDLTWDVKHAYISVA